MKITCCLNEKEYIEVKPHEKGILLEIYAPSMIDMNENASIVVSKEEIEDFKDLINDIHYRGGFTK